MIMISTFYIFVYLPWTLDELIALHMFDDCAMS